MQSGPVSASLLLSSFLGSEHEKIGQDIARSDFAGELGKLLTPSATVSDPTAASKSDLSPTDVKAVTEVERQSGVQSNANTTPAATQQSQATSTGPCRNKCASVNPKQRIENLKNRAQNSENLYITNPVLVESILAELQYPAETIKAYKSMQNQEGWISLKDFQELIASKSAPSGPATQGQIPAAQAQALLSCIVEKLENDSAGRNTFTSGKSTGLMSVVQKDTDGSLNIGEFRALLEQVMQRAGKVQQTRSKSSGATAGSSGATTEGAQITGQVTVAPRQGQAESLTSNILPSFLSDNSEDSRRKQSAAGPPEKTCDATTNAAYEAEHLPPEALSAGEGSIEPETFIPAPGIDTLSSHDLSPAQTQAATDFQPIQTQFAATMPAGINQGHDRDRFPADTGTQVPEKSIQPALAQTAETQMEVADKPDVIEPEQTLSSITEEFGATIISTGMDQTAASPDASRVQGAEPETIALPNQNIASIVKEAVREPGEKIIQPAEPLITQNLSDSTQNLDRIVTTQAENTEDETFPDYNPDRAAGLVKNYRDQMRPATAQGKTVEFPELGKSAESGNTAKGSLQADGLPVSGTGTAAGKEAGSLPVSMISKLAQPGEEGTHSNFSGENASRGQSWPEPGQAMTDQVDISQKPVSTLVSEDGVIQSRGVSALTKEVEKQLKAGDSSVDAALLQTGANRFSGSRIEMPITQEAPGGGLNYYDQSRSAELMENYREQYRGSGGQHLVLELEPEQFGKVSIKVGANRDEVSAIVLTENESARQAILKNSPELRQDLENQGLLLGKFQVDVGGENTGGEKGNPQWHKPENKTADAPGQAANNTNAQVRQRPAYIRRNGNLSQVSLFA